MFARRGSRGAFAPAGAALARFAATRAALRSCAAWLPAALLACVALTGCERNSATPYLIPTGVRPKLTTATGGVLGVLHYGLPLQRADLGVPPFPPSRVELLRGQDSTLVAYDSLATSTNIFKFTGLQPGPYLVRAIVRGFGSPLVRVTVLGTVRDAGDLTLPIASSIYSNFIGLIGDMPGYDVDSYYANIFLSPAIGIFTYPSDFHSDATVAVTAGIHEFMFVTDNSFSNDLIGWGGDSSEVLTPPLVNHRATFGHGPAHNLKVNFPTTGNYTFALDEARQTFTVTLATAAQNAHTQQYSRRIR